MQPPREGSAQRPPRLALSIEAMVPMVLVDSRYESEMEVGYDTVDSEHRAYEMVDPAIVESEDAPNEQFLANFGNN